MKALILVLLSVTAVQAQQKLPPGELAEFARQERDRRAQKPVEEKVYTTEETRRGTKSPLAITSPAEAPAAAAPVKAVASAPVKPAPPAPVAPAPAPAPKPAPVAPAPAPKPAAPAVDLEKEWNDRVNAQRAAVRALEDRRDVLKIQVRQYTDQYLAPVTDQNSMQAALNKLVETQGRLDQTDKELLAAQSKLRQMEAQGPPNR